MEKMSRETIWRIGGGIQHYSWGGYQFLPQLLGIEQPVAEPYAELWFGAHPRCPSVMSSGETLADKIRESPRDLYTAREYEQWREAFPFLCKVLDVRDMLSIQLHPDKASAAKGFAEEEQKNIPRDAFHRTFKDQNHKPEIMYALSPFYMLHAFRPDDEIRELFSRKTALRGFREEVAERGVDGFYREFMTRDQSEINRLLEPLIAELRSSASPKKGPAHPDYWAGIAAEKYCTPSRTDRGILSFYLMNLLELEPGRVIFQDNSVPHAYLRGQAVEVMADSDNVIRGGLTPKYVDVHRLSELIRFDQRHVYSLEAEKVSEVQRIYRPPVEEFSFSVLDLQGGISCPLKIPGISLFFSVSGEFSISVGGQRLEIGGGEAGLCRGEQEVSILSAADTTVFWVTTR